MVKLARSPQEREAMGRAGKEKVRRTFDWEVKVERMIEIYQQVVAQHTSRKDADLPSLVSSKTF